MRPYTLPLVCLLHALPLIPYMCAADAIHVAAATIMFAVSVDYGTSRHFCDDPDCPDTVWKVSKSA